MEKIKVAAQARQKAGVRGELSKLRANSNVNQYEDFCSSLSVIIFFTEKYSHIMGISFQNIF